MLDRRSNTAAALLIGLMFLAAAWVLAKVPPSAPIAIHFDAAGTPNGWAPAWIGMLGMPLLSAVVWGILMVLPRIDPRGENLVRSRRAVGAIGLATLAVLTIGQLLIATQALGIETPLSRSMGAVTGILFIGIGNVMGKLRWNYTVGVRTPWTIANERVWDKTHRFTGRLWVMAGVVMLASPSLPTLGSHQPATILTAAAICTVLPVLRSYLLWRAESRAAA